MVPLWLQGCPSCTFHTLYIYLCLINYDFLVSGIPWHSGRFTCVLVFIHTVIKGKWGSGQAFWMMMLNSNIIYLSEHLLNTFFMSCPIATISGYKNEKAFGLWETRSSGEKELMMDWNELRTMRTQEKRINFTEDIMKASWRKWHLRRVFKGMEKDNQGKRQRSMEVNELRGLVWHCVWCKERGSQGALSALVMVSPALLWDCHHYGQHGLRNRIMLHSFLTQEHIFTHQCQYMWWVENV